MAIYVDIVTGFLESGKTTFIEELLKSDILKEFEKIVLLVCEEGFTEYDNKRLKERNITIRVVEEEEELNDELFYQVEEEYEPDHILVEYNGMWNISGILGLKTPYEYKFRNVVFVSDAMNFQNQLNNMATVIQPHILNSNIAIVNRISKASEEIQKKIRKDIKNINPRTKVTFQDEISKDNVIRERFMTFLNPENNSWNLRMNLKVGLFLAICFCILIALEIPVIYQYMQSMMIIFLGILIQAIPFILLGAFISSAIQIFVSTSWIMQKMKEGKYLSFAIAAMAGAFMPICDCGMVPIISGLLRKDTPLPQTMTFWLASSAVSPVVIISMLYAFPDQPYLAVIRIVAGLCIGIVTGVLLRIFRIETKNVVKEERRVQNIGKDILELKYQGRKGKVEAVFSGAMVEFFRVAEYVIIGALISSFLQTIMPQTIKSMLLQNLFLQFVIMIVAAMLMSTCSTSNAFIGRSFSNNIATVPMLSFIVTGPMLDLKNMVMLSAILKKKFLVSLALIIIAESVILFGVLALFL